MVSIRPLICKICNNPLVTVTKAPITNVPQFFQFPSEVRVLILLFTFFHSYSVVSRDNKLHNFAQFLLIIIRSGLLAEIRWSVCMSKSHRSLCVSFSTTDAGLCIYHLFIWSNLNFLYNLSSSLLLLLSLLLLWFLSEWLTYESQLLPRITM